MGGNSIRWIINPVHIILVIIILGFGITCIVFFNKYMNAKYHIEELKETQLEAENAIKQAEKEKLVLTKQINSYRKKIKKWEDKFNAIKKPVNIRDARRLLYSE